MSEIEEIKKRYSRRDNKKKSVREERFQNFLFREREKIYLKTIKKTFSEVSKLSVLEIGAGEGNNIKFFKSLGISSKNIFANELLTERIKVLRAKHSDINIIEGDALQISSSKKFDIVFQSTVFTSILDESFRKKLAGKMIELTKPGGIILWYDFMFNNPNNPDVRKVSKDEIVKLFNTVKEIKFYRTTLAPPIARKVHNLYPFFNIFPFLRTHLIAAIYI